MDFFEKSISNLIEGQFPAFFREEGPLLVEFIKKYYEWMELEGNVTRESRKLMENRDIDSTVDEFLGHFRDKYLNGIQVETEIGTKNLVKHSLDLYRSKGTERAVDLFFRSVYGVPSEIYYPSQDIFKASSGDWRIPKYLELDSADGIENFIGSQIEGVTSGATAFAERFVRKRLSGQSNFNNVLYINSIVGSFLTGEKIRLSSTGVNGPTIVGSLNELTVIDGAGGYVKGELVDLISDSRGIGAKGRVKEVANITGVVSFNLVDGGWGYNSNSQIIVSDKVLTLSNVDSQSGATGFKRFETLYQPRFTLSFEDLDGDLTIPEATYVGLRYSNGSLYSIGSVIDYDEASDTSGSVDVIVTSGTMEPVARFSLEDGLALVAEDGTYILTEDQSNGTDGNVYFFSDSSGSTLVANATLLTSDDNSAFANLMAISSNVSIELSNVSVRFSNGESIYQLTGNVETANGKIDIISYNGLNAVALIVDTEGNFSLGGNLVSRSTSARGDISSVQELVGVFDITNDFVTTEGNYVQGLTSESRASVTRKSTGTGANVEVSNTYIDKETVSINIDYLRDYLFVGLSEDDFGFSAPGPENLESVISTSLSYLVEDFGSISSIRTRNSGTDYDATPFVVMYDPVLAPYNKRDFIVKVGDLVGGFSIGELVEQAGIVKGRVREGSNTSVLYLKRMTFYDLDTSEGIGLETDDEQLASETSIEMNMEAAAPLVGLVSGSTATVLSSTEDKDTDPIGLNAVIVANSATSSGAVTALSVTDSGFGYIDGETVTFRTPGKSEGTAEAHLVTSGTGSGFHKYNNSLLSDNKYLQDGDYYQEFSYEIRSSITLDRYAGMLKDILHLAGTKHFSKFSSQSTLESSIDVSSEMTIS